MVEKRTSLLIDQKQPIDLGLWEAFYDMEKRAEPVYDQLKLPAEELAAAKQKFFASGRQENPDLTVRAEGAQPLAEAEWLALKDEIKADTEIDMLLRQAYIWRINEMVAGVRMVDASRSGDMRRFKAYNEFVYGRPDPEIFAGITDWFRKWAEELSSDKNQAIREAAEQVLAQVPDVDGDRDVLKPSDEVFQLIRAQHFKEGGYLALALAGVELPEGQKVPLEVGDPALRQVLKNIGADRVVIADASGAAWSVDNSKDRFNRPAKYNMPYNRFVGLPIGHEARHRLEWENGLRQEARLFGGGLDRYEKGNEGRAVVGEQVAYKTFDEFTKQLRWQDLMRRSLAISLSLGLAGEPKDFSQTFAVINSIDRLWQRAKTPDEITDADAKADDRTWDLLATKAYKGTDGRGGRAYQKDNYLEYNVKVWRAAVANPELIELGDLGKFDITNPRHIQLAQAFNVLPSEE